MSAKDDAKKIIAGFASRSNGGNLWKGLRRDKVAAGALARIDDPSKIAQEEGQVCGPACFVRSVATDMPEVYARVVVELYERGQASVSRGGSASLYLRPSKQLMNYVPAAHLKIEPVDWLVLASVRDSANVFSGQMTSLPMGFNKYLDDLLGTAQSIAGMTLPGELEEWFEAAGYTEVVESTSLTRSKDLAHAQKASALYDEKYKVCLLIDTDVLYVEDQDNSSLVPNHWVMLALPITFSLRQGTLPAAKICDWEGRSRWCMTTQPTTHTDPKASTVSLAVYTWGEKQRPVPKSGVLSLGSFLGKYYGYVAARF